MANTYKNLIITPNRDTAANVVPTIQFSGGDTTTNTDIYLRVYTTSNGTLSLEGSAGQLFSVTNDLTNSIFSVNDVSGIPSVDVYANGNIFLAPYSGNVGIGSTTTPTAKLHVFGDLNVTGNVILGDASTDTITLRGSTISLGNNQNIDAGTLFVDGVNNRVGIGTTWPNTGFHINQSSNLRLSHPSASDTYYTDFVNQWDTSYPFFINVAVRGRPLGYKNILDYVASTPSFVSGFYGIAFATNTIDPTNTTVRMVITQSGNVSIGAGSHNNQPNSTLVVLGSANITGNLISSGVRSGYSSARPAFRVFGAGITNNLDTAVNGTGALTANNYTVELNQGNYLNSSTGVFTAPVPGIYQINVVGRNSGNTVSISQLAVTKNGSSGGVVGGTVMCMVEFGPNSSMNHAGMSSSVYMNTGDTLALKVLAGTINFDSNDNWSVVYIG